MSNKDRIVKMLIQDRKIVLYSALISSIMTTLLGIIIVNPIYEQTSQLSIFMFVLALYWFLLLAMYAFTKTFLLNNNG